MLACSVVSAEHPQGPNGDDESLLTACNHFQVCICFASGTVVLIVIADPRPTVPGC